MATVRIDLKDLPRAMKAQDGAQMDAIQKGIRRGLNRALVILVKNTPRDRSHMAAAWDASRVGKPGRKNNYEIGTIENDAPYAGIVEHGTRAGHKMGRAGIESLTGWVRRKLGIRDPKTARGVAFAIAKTLEKRGLKPTYFIRDSLEDVRDAIEKEVTRALGTVKPKGIG